MNLISLVRQTLVLTALTVGALAVPRELSLSASGPGEVERAGRSSEVRSARLNLQRDGKFSLNMGERYLATFGGTWKEVDRTTVQLEVSSAWGRPASAQGRILFERGRDGYRIENIKIAGGQNQSLIKARFSAGQVEEPPRPGPRPPGPDTLPDSTRWGRGWYQTEGRRPVRLSRATVKMFDNGRILIDATGDANLSYRGSWRPAGGGTVRVNVAGGRDGEQLSGLVTIEGRSFANISLSGSRAGSFYKVEFDAR